MRILTVAPDFPHERHPYSGIFSQRIVTTLSEQGHTVEVLCPKPFVPPGIGRIGRWSQYEAIPSSYSIGNVAVSRPTIPIVPGFKNAFWADQSAWFVLRRKVMARHRANPFDAILGFDLGGSGGLTWRLARDLKVPSACWAFGTEVRTDPTSGPGRSVANAIRHLDLAFYQSTELRECAGRLVGRDLSQPPDSAHHIVRPHGIRVDEIPPTVDRAEVLETLGFSKDRFVVLSVGRIVRDKGVFELVDAFTRVCESNPNAVLAMVGAIPTRDSSTELQALIDSRGLSDRIRIVPSVSPGRIPALLSAADIFVFTSHHEGMPNAVLEALHAGTPTVAYDIPPLREADPDAQALKLVPVANVDTLQDAIVSLAANSAEQRARAAAGQALVREKFDMRTNIARAVTEFTPFLTRT